MILWLMTWVIVQVPYRPPEEEDSNHASEGRRRNTRRRRRRRNIVDFYQDVEAGITRMHYRGRRNRRIGVNGSDSSSTSGSEGMMIDESLPAPPSFAHVV